MVKFAKTEEEIKKCKEYLKEKGTPALTNTFFYTEVEGKITSCAGVTLIPAIEPMQSDNIQSSYKLYHEVMGYIRGLGFTHVQAITNSEKAINELKRDGWIFWTPNIQQYIKEL